jgi:hypothetical protein
VPDRSAGRDVVDPTLICWQQYQEKNNIQKSDMTFGDTILSIAICRLL